MMDRHTKYKRMAAARSTLTPQEQDELGTHVATCATCRNTLEEYNRQDAFVRSLVLGDIPRGTESSRPSAAQPQAQPFCPSLVRASAGPRARAPQRILGFVALLVLGLAALGAVAYAASSIIHVYRPGDSSPRSLSRLFMGPSLPPYQTVHYRPLDPLKAAQQSGYAIAYLTSGYAGLDRSIGVDILPHVGWPPAEASFPQPVQPGLEGLAMAIRSVVRYHGGGHTAIVLLNEPSPKVIKTRELVLGQWSVQLPNGQEAWASNDVSQAPAFVRPRSGPVHVLAWVVDRYVVSIFSDLPLARLRMLAAGATVVPPNADPKQRHIPDNWPAPLPLDRLPAMLRAVIDGSATYRRQGGRLMVWYWIELGSYSQGALYGLDKWNNLGIDLVFPGQLQRYRQGPPVHQGFGSGSGGIGGDVTFRIGNWGKGRVATVVRQGITVRLAWTERGQHRHQSFHLPITSIARCHRQDNSCAMAVSSG